jgi:predicted nucleic acid-binding protein
MRVYLDTSILADWFFVRTVKPATRGKMKPQVLASHELVESVLRGYFHNDSFVTSTWGILEAVGVLKRARIEFNLFRDNISLSYYNRLKDQKGFRLEKEDAEELNEQLQILSRRAASRNRLIISDRPVESETVIDHVTLRCLDPTDAIHVAYALGEECDLLVTRDSELLDRKKSLASVIGMIHPKDLLGRLANARKPAK